MTPKSRITRFKGNVKCPVCAGCEDDERGDGSRCFGYLNGEYVYCTRENHAGKCEYVPGSNAYRHILKGECLCGVTHSPADPKPKKKKRNGKLDRSYKYFDLDGKVRHETVRFKDPKGFAQCHCGPNGKTVWSLTGVETILYRLPEISKADPSRTVWILEGEKDVDRLRSLDEVATCNPMGALKWRGANGRRYSETLRDRPCIIIGDNDDDGRKHGQEVAQSLRGVAASVKLVELPGLPEKGDVSDFLDLGGTLDQMRTLAADTAEWTRAPADSRPEIRITTAEKEVNDQAVAALATDPDIYRLGFVLATILQEGDAPRGVEYKDGPPPQISPIEPATLRERMAQSANWIGMKARGDQVELVPRHPPIWSVNAVHKRRNLAGIRPIVGVIETATIRRDGSILIVPGYDAATRLYLHPNVQIDAIPDRPSLQDARVALATIDDLIADFPFRNESHKLIWLIGLFTVLARASFDGPAPLIAFDGNCPGSGKSKLADLIATVASGRRMPRSIWPSGHHADEEVRKRITSMALAGERFTLLDNVDSPLGGGPLDAALTSDTWKDRALGSNTMTPELPLLMVWFASGNNIQFRGDFIRRALPCRLESPLENPEERTGFKYPDLLGHALTVRGPIIRSALIIIRAYQIAGRPAIVSPLGSFEGWSRAIADPVAWITGVDPFEVRTEVKASDQGSQLRGALVQGWSELPGADNGLTVADALKLLRDDKDCLHYGTLRSALMEMSDKADLPSAKSIGRILKTTQGRILGDLVLRGAPDLHTKVFTWKVVRHPADKPASNAGFAGFAVFASSGSQVRSGAGVCATRP